FCADEHQHCAFTGAMQVRYGASGTYTAPRSFTDGVDCENSIFGDPLPTVVKECEILGSSSGSPPPPSPAPAPPAATSGPITITSGGTYTGNWESTSPTPAITIATSQPVTIVNSIVRNLAGGTLINAVPGGSVQVTVQNTQAYGGGSYQSSGRFFVAEN